jgi:hypothetical protein
MTVGEGTRRAAKRENTRLFGRLVSSILSPGVTDTYQYLVMVWLRPCSCGQSPSRRYLAQHLGSNWYGVDVAHLVSEKKKWENWLGQVGRH